MGKRPDSYDDAMWRWIVAYGGAVKSNGKSYKEYEDYYGARLNFDATLSREAFESLTVHGINLAACTDPAQNVGSGFNGTFTSTQLQFTYLLGKLVTNDGKEFMWGAMCPNEQESFSGLVRLLSTDIEWDDALMRLVKRTDARLGFPYDCNLPRIKAVRYVIEEG